MPPTNSPARDNGDASGTPDTPRNEGPPEESVARRASRSELLLLRIQRRILDEAVSLRQRLRGEGTVYIEHRGDEYREHWCAAARMLGADFAHIADGVLEVRLGERATRVLGHRVPLDDLVTDRISGDKPFVLRLAEQAGVPVTEYHCFTLDGLTDAWSFVEASPLPCVVKPATEGGASKGVTSYVSRPRTFRRAALFASLVSSELMVERVVAGEAYRLLYLDGEMIHAVRRRGVRLPEADGDSTIAQIAQREHPGLPLHDPVVVATLSGQGLSSASVPPAGESILLRNLPVGNDGGPEPPTAYDENVTDEIAPALEDELRRVVDAVGSRYAGVDIITTDPSQPLSKSGGAFIELNTSPGLHQHYQHHEDEHAHALAVTILGRALDGRSPSGV